MIGDATSRVACRDLLWRGFRGSTLERSGLSFGTRLIGSVGHAESSGEDRVRSRERFVTQVQNALKANKYEPPIVFLYVRFQFKRYEQGKVDVTRNYGSDSTTGARRHQVTTK